MFFVKKLIQALFLPASSLLILLVAALVLIVFRKKLGRILLLIAIAFYYILSIQPVSQSLLRGLENRYAVKETAPEHIKYVVVLGGGALNNFSGLPATSRLDPSSMARILEGIRLFEQTENAYLVTTGGTWFTDEGDGSACVQMKNLAITLGVDEKRILAECSARDTYEEAKGIKKMLAEEPFLLVTSGYHMPRAVYIFKKLGMNPLPAPCGMKAQSRVGYTFRDYIPAFWVLENSSLALNEYAGLIFYRFLR